MKLDQNNIDDLFKDALGDFTEQPSSGAWKNIAGKLFWNDLAHFRFVKAPKVWVGVASAGLIITTLFFMNPVSEQELAVNPEMTQNKEKVTIENAGAGSSISEPSNTNETYIINPDNKNEVNRMLPLSPKLPEIPAADKQIVPIQKSNSEFTEISIQTVTTPAQSDHNMVQDEALSGENADQPDVIETAGAVALVSGVSTPVSPGDTPVKKSAGAAFVNENPSTSTMANQEGSPKTDEVPAISINTTENPISVEQLESKEIRSLEMIARDAGSLDQAQPSDLQTQFLSSRQFDESVNNAGKIQKIHSLSFSMGQLFKGKYKPPKRSFQEPGMSLYRGHQPYFSVSAYFAPEVTEYTRMASQSRENSYLGGVAVSYNSSKYVLQSGLEISYSNDLGDYMVNMDTYDSVGYYNEVIGFVIDPNNPDSVILQIEQVAIWDSVSHQSHQQTQNSYTYLQIPIMFGYKAMESGRFSAHIKAGPSFSFLLNRKEPQPDFQFQGATIKSVENYTPQRLNTCIQILVSLALQFNFTENFGLLVEPTYRYYLNSVYDVNDESIKNPYGIGVRGGLFYNF